MEVHIASPWLVVFELGNETAVDRDLAGALVHEVLTQCGLDDWSSIEIEHFTYYSKQLIVAKPIKLYMPNWLTPV